MIVGKQVTASKGEAVCTCDQCKKQSITMNAKLGHYPLASKKSNTKQKVPPITNIESIKHLLSKQGWSVKSKIIICPSCVAASKPKESDMNTKQELRQPTKSQKREIMLLLTDVYDTENERYKGTETDKSIAECLGDGIMWGWVAQIREEYFGPDGNEANLAAVEEIQQWIDSSQQVIEEFNKTVKEYNQMLRELDEIRKQGVKLIAKVKL